MRKATLTVIENATRSNAVSPNHFFRRSQLNRVGALILLSSPLLVAEATHAEEAAQASGVSDAAVENKKAIDGLQGEVKKLKGAIKLSGFFQGRFETDETSKDGIKDDGKTPLNKDQLSIRRAQVKATYTGVPYSEAALQINATGAGISLLDAEVSLLSPVKDVGGKLTLGQQVVPFGAEIAVSNRDLEVSERATVINKLFPGIRDRGLKLAIDWKFLRLAVGIYNGNGIQDTSTTFSYQVDKDASGTIDEGEEAIKTSAALNFGNTDRDKKKDFIGRAGVDFGVVNAGLNAYVGEWGKLPTLIATTDSSTGVTTYAGGDTLTYIPKTRYGVDLTASAELIKGLGKSLLRAEYITGHGIFSGTDEKDTDTSGWIATVAQELTSKAQVAVRVDQFDPDLASENDTTFTIEPAVHFFPTAATRVSLTYQLINDFDKKNDDGTKSDKANNHLTLQLQGKF